MKGNKKGSNKIAITLTITVFIFMGIGMLIHTIIISQRPQCMRVTPEIKKLLIQKKKTSGVVKIEVSNRAICYNDYIALVPIYMKLKIFRRSPITEGCSLAVFYFQGERKVLKDILSYSDVVRDPKLMKALFLSGEDRCFFNN